MYLFVFGQFWFPIIQVLLYTFFFFLTYAGDSNPGLDLSVWRVHVLSGTPASFHSPKTCMRLG